MSRGASDEAIAGLRSEAEALEGQMINLLSDINQQASKGQIQTLVAQTEKFIAALKEQHEKLQETEARLAKAQQEVIGRELSQQEIKTARQEDEQKLVEVMSNYQDFSSQSVALEHKLAQTLRSLDAMIAENPLNADQRALFQELSNALTTASAQLRDVIVDYQAVFERLEALRGQYADLEKEYTKLVDLQLGS
jgi:chromosome segregation ATPase